MYMYYYMYYMYVYHQRYNLKEQFDNAGKHAYLLNWGNSGGVSGCGDRGDGEGWRRGD